PSTSVAPTSLSTGEPTPPSGRPSTASPASSSSTPAKPETACSSVSMASQLPDCSRHLRHSPPNNLKTRCQISPSQKPLSSVSIVVHQKVNVLSSSTDPRTNIHALRKTCCRFARRPASCPAGPAARHAPPRYAQYRHCQAHRRRQPHPLWPHDGR